MTAFLLAAAVLVLGMVVMALARLLRGRQPLDWIMTAQLLGTAGIAALLLFGTATRATGALDLALLLALLAAFGTMAFAASVRTRAERAPGGQPPNTGIGAEAPVEPGAGAAAAGDAHGPASGAPGSVADRGIGP